MQLPLLDMGHLTAHRTTKSLGCQVLGTGVIRITPLAAHLTLKEPGPPVSERTTFQLSAVPRQPWTELLWRQLLAEASPPAT